MICVEVGWPEEMEPHADIVRAARFVGGDAKVGDVLEFVHDNAVRRDLVAGFEVAFKVLPSMSPPLPREHVGGVGAAPLIIGMSKPSPIPMTV